MSAKTGAHGDLSFSKRLVHAAILVGFFVLFAVYSAPVVMLPDQVVAVVFALLAGHVFLLSVLVLRGVTVRRGRIAAPLLLLAMAIVITLPFAFTRAAFGTRDMASFLMTLGETRPGTLIEVGLDGFLGEIGRFLGLSLGLLIGARVVVRSVPFGRTTVLGLALLALLFGPLPHYGFRTMIPHPAHAMLDLDSVHRWPDIVAAPDRPKNLVIIYMESLERSYRDLPASREAFAAFARLEDEGLSFRNIRQGAGTGFTAGGLVATQCGVPLLPRGVMNLSHKINDSLDTIPEQEDFMVGVSCLGDVLAAEGYRASYINGSDLAIHSKGSFFRSHGYGAVRGLTSFDGWDTEPRRNVWGMDDDLLFERVTAELNRLAASGDPFLLSALTIATHGPDGYPDGSCPVADGAAASLRAAIACTARHVEALRAHIDRLGLADDTLLVLLSDHLAFRNAFERDLRGIGPDRRNYAVVLGAGPGVNLRDATMLDVYPTLLELAGFELSDGGAGLGQSLLSPQRTFLEREGLAVFDAAVQNNAALQKALWRRPDEH